MNDIALKGTSSNGLLGHPVGHPVARSPPGVTILSMDSVVGSNPMCDSVTQVFFHFWNLKILNC